MLNKKIDVFGEIIQWLWSQQKGENGKSEVNGFWWYT